MNIMKRWIDTAQWFSWGKVQDMMNQNLSGLPDITTPVFVQFQELKYGDVNEINSILLMLNCHFLGKGKVNTPS